MTTKIRTVLFDLDGTIMDTNELIIQSFMHALKGIVPSDFGREHIIPSMGLPLTDQMQLFSGIEDVTELVAAYREINLRLHDDYVKAFPYVQEVMARLQAEGIQLGIVTTKMRLTTERGLRYVGLYEYIVPNAIVTIEDVAHAKPHPEPVQKAVDALGANPAATLMVGDSGVDIESAEAAGVISVGVAWSLKGEAKLRESGARHIIHDMRDLYAIVGLE
ncbi:pyrophosphatase PpaX [Paenibacillus baekrokdamisoli]|uniref:Pyrophosphatase PpaX n=1 Tax=Paenibacillus baekrokdamisoli TaxID=1712516 RepID=A0A3G9JGF5_9BACL|nr:pyrophosphatase PpaX [Paenibacillus baekrokdamisoli]MBB3067810.1 pyrophosphatase PpaX [Paenibacillus baekrokdamisoli]BBH23148.1 pyrophosphatase PpaX [Paenibacillus baekrokdamisoli]